jgi:predicted nucleotidyltransferase
MLHGDPRVARVRHINPESDTDYRGVCVAPPEYYLGALSHFEQAESRDPDFTVFDVKKFIPPREPVQP